MPDIFTKAKRSDVMSRIRSRGNARTELALVRVFRAHGITGWRRQLKLRVGELRAESRKPARPAGHLASQPSTLNARLAVRPDFVFHRQRLAVFVDGCFWHGCPQHGTRPKGNAAFWRRKFAANIARDRRVNRALRRAGWRVLRIWEHELRQCGTRNAERGRGKRRSPPSPRRGAGAAARLVGRLRRALAGRPGDFTASPGLPYPAGA